jgi:hypothetical protein
MFPNNTAVPAVSGLASQHDDDEMTDNRPSGIYLRAAAPIDAAPSTEPDGPGAEVIPLPAPLPLDRDRQRSRRKRLVKARTISVKRTSKQELAMGRILYPEMDVERPATRADCKDGCRPCPFVSCKHHLYLDVNARTGAIKLNFPDLEVWEMSETCALDVADRSAATLEETGGIMNLTRERIRQLEVTGLAKLAAVRDLRELVDGEGDSKKRRLPLAPSAAEARTGDDDGDDEDEGEDDLDDEVDALFAGPAGDASPPSADDFDVDAFVSDALD